MGSPLSKHFLSKRSLNKCLLLVGVVALVGFGCSSSAPTSTPNTTAASTAASTTRAEPTTQAEPDSSITSTSTAPTTAPSTTAATTQAEPDSGPAPRLAKSLGFEILKTIPHSQSAFTQGLIFIDGIFYESTGSPGDLPSYLFAYNISQSANPPIRQELEPQDFSEFISSALPQDPFAEGLELIGNKLYQLTWLDELGFIWELDSSTSSPSALATPSSPAAPVPAGIFTYEGQGWGLCYDGTFLYRSDGTDKIVKHNPETLAAEGEIFVTQNGQEFEGRLNELECAEGSIWANVWLTNTILRIHPETGEVTGILDASRLELPRPQDREAVLNGIAYDSDTDTYWLTGKYWRNLYQVDIFEADSG